MKTIDYQFSKLCNKIDQWKEEAEYWKAKYEALNKEYNAHLDKSLIESQKGIANAFMFALSVKDDENGNLIIDKNGRKELGENWNS